MTQIPYDDPGTDLSAKAIVNGPSIGLMATAGIGGALQLLGLVLNVFNVGMGTVAGRDAPFASILNGGIGILSNIIGLIMSVVVFLGATKMRNLQSYSFAMAASIIAMIPCISPCCVPGLPLGIWALVVLLKPEVKIAFTD